MTKKIRQFIQSLVPKIPLTYSLVLILLVPVLLVVNTLWNLRSYERDMHFGVREQTIEIKEALVPLISDARVSDDQLHEYLQTIVDASNNIQQLSLYSLSSDSVLELAFSTDKTANVEAGFTENLALSQDNEFFSQEYDSTVQNNVWKLVAPILNNGEVTRVLSLSVNTLQVDAIVERTARDSMVIMLVSVTVIVLLLINHARALERSLLVDKLREVDHMKDDFISVASHELRTPITAIKGYVSLLQKDLQSNINEKQHKEFGIVMESIYRLETLVNDVLNVSRIEQGRLDVTVEPVNLSEIITETHQQLMAVAQEKRLDLVVNNIPESLVVLGNADRMREVFTNIVGNAIKYTKQGSVTISVANEKSRVRVMIEDTGIGIAPEDRVRLFQKFSRIQNDETVNITGTGLGLWITKQLVEKMDASIYVDSLFERGTTFTIVFKKAMQ
ncbi:hypothetical protein CO180_03680 [candidate division WWE3 bacterium CG_4_9_14_3_um_filter_41_6]|uniref:histidine kinase n=1 Tax=candidate division WWE3 bacterium CG_4_10_14_0_2_um_filter_41_14 TaxID=1975072 RepID=A0A2M7TKR7_UNCKA|nr:MAG: hypothetical protein COY32_01610 [candidate division WWE3 bacterium CG_4_10_14_0_2_um_filter_41_14]PJA38382.1 MAG: hypothetical protein CO180_03680 [candidate division WWE3 bacterium CG_4_9_14_3_um_filter_41_6]